MLIRSQDKMQIIPFGEFVFTSTKDGKITCDKDIITILSEIKHRVVAEYSTQEKAVKALDMICDAYARFRGENVYTDSVFYMPQESEVE